MHQRLGCYERSLAAKASRKVNEIEHSKIINILRRTSIHRRVLEALLALRQSHALLEINFIAIVKYHDARSRDLRRRKNVYREKHWVRKQVLEQKIL